MIPAETIILKNTDVLQGIVRESKRVDLVKLSGPLGKRVRRKRTVVETFIKITEAYWS
ncbi:MAG: hypothetical protein P8X91_09985 [Candidatus Bathyarchaeota archaeon]